MGLFLFIVFIVDIQNCCCKNEQRWRGGKLFHAVLFCYCFVVSPFSMQVD
jgi:hypothetical protein